MRKTENSDEIRFLSLIRLLENGCWKLGRYKHLPKNYSETIMNGKRIYGHRMSYQIFNGKLDNGLVIDHTCMNKYCVNPDHLRQVTKKINTFENTKRKISNFCTNGHEFTQENTLYRKDTEGYMCRYCRACNKKRCIERHRRSIVVST